MNGRFGGRLAIAIQHGSFAVDEQEASSRQFAFVQAAGCDRELQRLPGDCGAEVAAGAEHPAALVELVRYFRQFAGGGIEVGRRRHS